MTIGEVQALIYSRIKLQGRIRTLGRIASYIVITACFIGITKLYQINKTDTSENILAIVVTALYAILIQDQINAFIQILLICCMGSTGKPQGCAKSLKTFILKEVWALFPVVKQEIIPVNNGFPQNLAAIGIKDEPNTNNMSNITENGNQNVTINEQNE